MNTRSKTRDGNKDTTLYRLYDWGDNPPVIPAYQRAVSPISDSGDIDSDSDKISFAENVKDFLAVCKEEGTDKESYLLSDSDSDKDSFAENVKDFLAVCKEESKDRESYLLSNKKDNYNDTYGIYETPEELDQFTEHVTDYLNRCINTEHATDYLNRCTSGRLTGVEFQSYEWDDELFAPRELSFEDKEQEEESNDHKEEQSDVQEEEQSDVHEEEQSDDNEEEEVEELDNSVNSAPNLHTATDIQPQQATMSEKFMELEVFHDRQTEDPREWLEKAESWFSYKNYANLPDPATITDDVEKQSVVTSIATAKRKVPHLLTLLLQGSAGVWLSGLAATDKETFANFKEKFKTRYLSDNQRYKTLVNVWEKKQLPTETVDTFYDSHVKLVSLAGLTADAHTHQAFVHGLLPHLKMQVMMQGKTELADILQAARLAETAYSIAVGSTASHPIATASKKITKTEVSNVQGRVQEVAPKIAQEVRRIEASDETQMGQQQGGAQHSEQQQGGNTQNFIGQWKPGEERRQPVEQNWQPRFQPRFQNRQQQNWQPTFRNRLQNPQQNWQPSSRQRQSNSQSSQNWQPTAGSRQQQGTDEPSECRNCGLNHIPGRTYCKMADKTCHSCGKLGHSYRLCRSSGNAQAQTNQSRQNWQPRQEQVQSSAQINNQQGGLSGQ